MAREYRTKPRDERLLFQPSIPMTEGMLNALRTRAEAAGTTLAALVRRAVEKLLSEPEEERK